jgi:hypothetical protein
VIEDRIYIVLSLRNVGPGIGVLFGGRLYPERDRLRGDVDLASFRMLSRDIYIPPGKIGFWQIAYRDTHDADYDPMLRAIERGEFMADVLYGDYEGGQRVVSRYAVIRDDDGEWRISTVRHVQIDRAEPRSHD